MVTVLSYNTNCIPYITSTQHVDAVCDFIAKLFAQHRPEIIALSEIFQTWVRDHVLQRLHDLLPGAWKATPIVHPASVTVSSGLLVLWNTQHVTRTGSMRSVLFKRCCQMDCLSNKGAISIPFQVKNSAPMTLVHTHMQAWEPSLLCSQVRSSQFSQLKTLLDQSKGNGGLLVTGDFNENPRTEFAQENGLHVPPGYHQTFETYYYDHVYSSSPNTTIQIASDGPDMGPSDHKAVIIKM